MLYLKAQKTTRPTLGYRDFVPNGTRGRFVPLGTTYR